MNILKVNSMLKKLRLTEKALIITNSLVIISSLVLALLFTDQTNKMVRGQFEERGRILAGTLAYNAEYGLLTGNDEALKTLVKGAMDQPDVIFCVIKDSEGREVLASYSEKTGPVPAFVRWTEASRKEVKGLTLQHFRERGNEFYSIGAPVLTMASVEVGSENLLMDESGTEAGKTRVIGSVNIGISLASADAIIWNTQKTTIQLVALLVFLASFISVLWIRRTLRPISQLLEGTRMIAKGDLAYRVKIKSSDEIGDLAVSFNKMAEELRNTTVSIGKLKESEKRFEDIAETSGDWIWETDSEGKYTFTNPVVESVIGYEQREVEGRYFWDFFRPEEQAYIKNQTLEAYANKAVIKNLIGKYVTKFGDFVILEISAMPVVDASGQLRGYRGASRDITERKKAEKALLETVRLKSNFTATVSHELRTPLTAIKEGISIVLEGVAGEINADQKDFLDTARRNVDRLNRLINDVLDFTKLKSAKTPMKMKEEDMNKVVEEAVKVHRPLAESKKLYLKTELAQDVPKIKCDADKIIQVINNLVGNALKFTQSGGITVAVEKSGSGVRVNVRDTGPGISKENIPRLFEEFYQLGDAQHSGAGGTGLGLAISKEIIERHGGKIWIESEVGRGSQFKFFIPAQREYRILVVDDDGAFRAFCGELLRKNGYDVLEAATGMDGIKELQEKHPDMVILDLKLPDINGYEVIGRIHSDKDMSATAIIVVSGYLDQLEKLDALDNRFTIPRLVKPFDGQELLGVIKTLIETKRI